MSTTAQDRNYYQTLVARDAVIPDPKRTGETALAWMADELVIVDEASVCVPSQPDERRLGFGPGELWQSAIVEIDESFLERECNGVESVTGRQVFDAGEYDTRPHCPGCNTPVVADAPTLDQWKKALEAWARGDDRAALECPTCGQTAPIARWRHDPPVGFGNLGLVFWNWPSLNREFIVRLGRAIGYDLMLVEGRR
jgi:hypothetical protein